jgi:Protein O-mannosyl-transferase TMEM260-like
MFTLVVAELIVTASYVAELQRRSKKAARKGRKISPHSMGTAAAGNYSWLLTIAPAIGAGLLLAFSRTLWSYATIAEVYPLNAFLILTVFFLMLRWRRRVVEDERSTSVIAHSRGPKLFIANYDFLLYAAAVVFGLALGVHRVTIALILPALAILVYKTQGLRFFASKRLFYAAVVSLAPLLAVYSYLPLAAAHGPILNWGDPRSLPRNLGARHGQAVSALSP